MLLFPTAAATEPETVIAQYTNHLRQVSFEVVQDVGGDLIFRFTVPTTFKGAYKGEAIYACIDTLNLATLEETFKCTGNFEGSVNGVSGSWIFEHEGRGINDPSLDPALASVSGQYTVRSATDDLAGYRAHGTFEGSFAKGTFISEQHFDP